MRKQLEIFKQNLEAFASKYKNQINEDPDFRKKFNQLCMKIGVDPLASNKGFWAELLGVGDFYYELAIQICEICLSTREINGGLMSIQEALQRVRKRRRGNEIITLDDIERAVRKLDSFGGGFKILNTGHKKMIQSVPLELSDDHASILNLAQSKGYVTRKMIKHEFNWDESRIDRSLDLLMKEGMAWLDTSQSEDEYWFPSLFFGSSADHVVA